VVAGKKKIPRTFVGLPLIYATALLYRVNTCLNIGTKIMKWNPEFRDLEFLVHDVSQGLNYFI
jgi:hypothetical protein